MNAAIERDPLQPRPPGGLGAGAGLAVAAHAALIAALVGGLQWRTETPTVVSAELWAAVPQTAAPRPTPQEVTPPPAPTPAPPPPPPPPPAAQREPPPPDPQIALAQERRAREAREQAERERLQREQLQRERAERTERERLERERERAERARAERERQAAEARVAQQREEQLRRLMGASGPATSTGTAAQDAAPSRGYAGRLVAHIKPNIVFTDQVPGNPAAEVEVRAAPGGSIISRRLVKSSGHRDWDEAVLRAIDRTGTLPRDVDGRVPSPILVSFRPQE